MRKEARIRQHLNRANQAAAEVYERHFEERKILTRIRLELESLRILVQRINKRERLKREGVKAQSLHSPASTPCDLLSPQQALVLIRLLVSADSSSHECRAAGEL